MRTRFSDSSTSRPSVHQFAGHDAVRWHTRTAVARWHQPLAEDTGSVSSWRRGTWPFPPEVGRSFQEQLENKHWLVSKKVQTVTRLFRVSGSNGNARISTVVPPTRQSSFAPGELARNFRGVSWQIRNKRFFTPQIWIANAYLLSNLQIWRALKPSASNANETV